VIRGPEDLVGEHEIHCPNRLGGERFSLMVYRNGSTHVPCSAKFQCKACGYKLEPRRKIDPHEAFLMKGVTIELSQKDKAEYLERLKEAEAIVEASDYGLVVESREDFCNQTGTLVEFVEIKFEKGQSDVTCFNRVKCTACPRIQPLSDRMREKIATLKEMERWQRFHAFIESKGHSPQQFYGLPSKTRKEVITEYKSKSDPDDIPEGL